MIKSKLFTEQIDKIANKYLALSACFISLVRPCFFQPGSKNADQRVVGWKMFQD
jgi:hypothetical protein